MTISNGSFILLVCSTMTGLIVEAIKKIVKVKKPNIVAAIVSVVVGVVVPACSIYLSEAPFNAQAIMYIVSIVVLSFLCSTLGYDKVTQTIAQLKR